MRILRVTILLLMGIVSLASVNQIIFQAPALLSLGSVALLFLAVVSFLILPILQKQSLFFSPVFWLIGCLLLQLVLLTQVSGNSTQFISFTLIAVLLLLVAYGLTYRINKGLRQIDHQAMETAVSPASPDIPTIEQLETIIHNEMTRSRHYERPLAIIAFRLDPGNLPGNLPNDQQPQIVQHLRSHMQRYHHLTRQSKDNLFFLICPEFDTTSAQKFGQLISETIASQNNITIQYATASFPEDGFTFNKIRKEALKRIETT